MALFAPLPSSFPLLTNAAEAFGRSNSDPPPTDLSSLAERLREAYRRSRSRNYTSLSLSQWRQLPYAYWDGGPTPLAEVEPKLVRRYWNTVLREALISRPTVASRWLAPLLHVYTASFNPQSRDFTQFASGIRKLLPQAVGPLAESLRQSQRRVNYFEPKALGQRLAASLLEHRDAIPDWLRQFDLTEDVSKTPLGDAIFVSLLGAGPAILRQEASIDKVLGWSDMTGIQPHRSPLRRDFAESLLLPWSDHRHQAGPAIRDKLLHSFVYASPETYGDPRWKGRTDYQWRGVADPAVSVVRRWLAGRSLEAFIQALKLTADEKWMYREKFWLAYHRRGLIDDVCLVLGSMAHEKIGYHELGAGMRPARLTHDSPGRRSVLIINLGKLTFVEWSHDGALRAYRQDDPNAPRLHANEYSKEELSDDRSLWMHDATADNKNPHLTHSGSKNGTWQRQARDFIRRSTGEHVPDSEILL